MVQNRSKESGKHFIRNSLIGIGAMNVATLGVTTCVETVFAHKPLEQSVLAGLAFTGIEDVLLLMSVGPVVALMWLNASKTDRFHMRHGNPSRNDFNW